MSNWQPIETAPKDGTPILLALRAPWSRIALARWFEPWRNWQEGEHLPDPNIDDFCGIGSAVPTHWQPLPAPPELPTS